MELKIKFPGGGHVEFKCEPMGLERFEYICWLVGIFLVGSGILKFFSLMD